jgi:sodium/potassium-transporting ATPase subunit alpha
MNEEKSTKSNLAGNEMMPSPSIQFLQQRAKSYASYAWAQMKEEEDRSKKVKEEMSDLAKKAPSAKGKSDNLESKVKKANISDWLEHKLMPASFFELMKAKFDKSSEEISKTFEELTQTPREFLKGFNSYEEHDPNLKELTSEVKDKLYKYGMDVQKKYLTTGLTKAEVARRRMIDGPNKLPEKPKTPGIIKFLHEISSVFAMLMWIGAALAFIAYGLAPTDMANLYLAIVLILVVLITGVFSYFQNEKSDEIMDSFKSYSVSTTNVLREGKKETVPSEDLVYGDVIYISSGNKIPADVRIFEYVDFQVDNSPLTGESKFLKRTGECGEKGKADPLLAENIAFFSTLCKNGSATGIVIKTGKETFMGRIADLASTAEASITTLQIELNYFIWVIAKIAIFLGVLFFILGLIIEYPILVNFIYALGIIVANVPEGLLATVTIALAVTAKKMLKRKIMVKNLQSVETLGSITCICSDKTGTLTVNKMKVVHVWYDLKARSTRRDEEYLEYGNNQYLPVDPINENEPSFEILKFANVCGSTGEFMESIEEYPEYKSEFNSWKKNNPKATDEDVKKQNEYLANKYKAEYKKYYDENITARKMKDANPSEEGILKFFESYEHIENTRNKYPIHSLYDKKIVHPFNSNDKYAAAVCRILDPKDSNKYTYRIAIKGAPERIEQLCDKYILNGKIFQKDKTFEEEFNNVNRAFQYKGERVIGCAIIDMDPIKFNQDYNGFLVASDRKQEIPKDGGEKIKQTFEVKLPKIENAIFVGVIAMEDPPRDGVKEAIAECKRAGIKVIMVTGDQAITAASIAHQTGIIEDMNDTPAIIKYNEKLATLEEAEAKSKAIIIEGDRLKKIMEEDEMLSENNPRKGAVLREWLMKRDVVFARTSPEQKLIIVQGCQSLQHVVAVTGDGVNDSPAIKKADIGIAMGIVGTDVAKDAADILLLDDNFANIVKGIKQGRVIFDLLKKIIGYCLTSNVPELIPFLGLVILQFPLPMTTILILCIDVGTDIYPNCSMAREVPEKGMMLQPPRNVKTDKLCPLKLFFVAYGIYGVLQTAGAFLVYYGVMNDYGFYPNNLFFFANKESIIPAAQDIYNPYDKYRGNSPAFIVENGDLLSIHGEGVEMLIEEPRRALEYATEGDISVDLRVFFYEKPDSFWASCAFDSVGQNYDGPVCYRIEALRHAQGAYLLAVVILQFANTLIYKTKIYSVFTHLFKNHYINVSYIVGTALILMLLYIPGLNTGFGIRALRIEHFSPCLGMSIIFFGWSEFMKWRIRREHNPDGSKNWFHKYFLF